MTRTARIPKLPLLEKVVLTIDEACAVSGMGLTTIYAAIKTGQLEARKKGPRMIVLRKELDRYIENLPLAGGRSEAQ